MKVINKNQLGEIFMMKILEKVENIAQ